jgi:hypothetical protein
MCSNARTRLLSFKIITPSVPHTHEAFMRQPGIGGQLPFAPSLPRLVWRADSLDVPASPDIPLGQPR